MKSGALSKLLAIVFAIIAFSAGFMPWLRYPVMDVSIPGHYGDGVVTSGLIVISLVLFLLLKNNLRNYLPPFISFIVFIIASSKFFLKDTSIKNTSELTGPDLLISMGTSGYYIEYGIYVLLISSFFLTIFYVINAFVKKQAKDNRISLYALITVFVIALVYILLKFFVYSGNMSDEAKMQMESEFKQMNSAISQRDADEYIKYFPDELISANGGEDMIRNVLSEANVNLPSNLKVNSIQVLQSDSSINGLQVLFKASITDDQGKAYEQRVLGIYSKATKAWQFASTDNYTFEDLSKLLPNLSKRLKY